MKLRSCSTHGYVSRIFYCPGCKCAHSVRIATPPGNNGPVWGFNGDMEKPTFTPSILCNPSLPARSAGRCHTFVRDGMIQFLDDCGHELAGKTVPIPEWPHNEETAPYDADAEKE